VTAYLDATRAPRMTSRSAFLLTPAILLAVIAVAWWKTIVDTRRMDCMLDGLVQAGRTMPFDTNPVRFAGTWTVMMAAMMLPGIIAVASGSRPLGGVALASGYLAVWISTAVIVFGVLTVLNEVGQPNASLNRVGGVVLAAAGAHQFTSWKRRLLTGLDKHDQNLSAAGAFGAGLSHGARCVGCSWALMSVLLVVGVMNLAWMAAIGVICLAEKMFTHRAALTTGVGLALVVVGLGVLIDPGSLDVIAAIR
jgi:predicted metal-binding membrane protein